MKLYMIVFHIWFICMKILGEYYILSVIKKIKYIVNLIIILQKPAFHKIGKFKKWRFFR